MDLVLAAGTQRHSLFYNFADLVCHVFALEAGKQAR